MGGRIFSVTKAGHVLASAIFWNQNLYFWLSPTPNRIFLILGGLSHKKKHEYLDLEYSSNKLFKTRRKPIITRLLSFQSVMLRINRA